MHEAHRLGHVEITERPQPGAKNLPDVVKITSLEWHACTRVGVFGQIAKSSLPGGGEETATRGSPMVLNPARGGAGREY
jgi:hypothetical protein